MIEVHGVYDNGIVRLLEPVPVFEPCPVKVVFDVEPPSKKEEHTEAQRAALAMIGLLSDLTPEEQLMFDGALRHRPPRLPHRRRIESACIGVSLPG